MGTSPVTVPQTFLLLTINPCVSSSVVAIACLLPLPVAKISCHLVHPYIYHCPHLWLKSMSSSSRVPMEGRAPGTTLQILNLLLEQTKECTIGLGWQTGKIAGERERDNSLYVTTAHTCRVTISTCFPFALFTWTRTKLKSNVTHQEHFSMASWPSWSRVALHMKGLG